MLHALLSLYNKREIFCRNNSILPCGRAFQIFTNLRTVLRGKNGDMTLCLFRKNELVSLFISNHNVLAGPPVPANMHLKL